MHSARGLSLWCVWNWSVNGVDIPSCTSLASSLARQSKRFDEVLRPTPDRCRAEGVAIV